MTLPSSYPSKSMNLYNSLLWIIPTSVLWIYLWFFPWQGIFRSIYWFPLGIGVILFTIPGICIYGLLMKRPTVNVSHITSGFVISHLLLALLGTLGRFTHLSFTAVKILFVIAGLILILKYLRLKTQEGIKFLNWQINSKKFLPVLLLLLVAVAACTIVVNRVLSDDDLSYLAYITSWQNSNHLDFNDVVFGESEVVLPRFWLISAPFAQALIADISHIPSVLLLSGYYEPFLVILAVLCWYQLARTLEFSPQAASASSMVQLVILLFLSEYLHPGSPFYYQLSSDKATAAFIMSPVFFQSLFRLLKRSTKSNIIIFFLAGLSLTLMHPVILAYSIFISGVLILFNWKNIEFANRIIIIFILIAILLPQIALRFSNRYSQAEIPYTIEGILNQRGIENLVNRWGDTQFYGFNPSILDMKIPYGENLPVPQPIIAKGWLVLPILSTTFALKQLRQKKSAQFLLTCFLLGFLAGIPFTGWIIGYFLSAYMLERAIWLFPFGLSAIYTFLIIRDNLQKIMRPQILPRWNRSIPTYWHLVSITVITIGLFFLYLYENNLPNYEKFLDKSQRYQGLSMAGSALDQHISDRAYVIGSPNLNDLIPSISWKSNLITFRISDPLNMSYYTQQEIDERISDTHSLFLNSTSVKEKMDIIEKYDVRFLFITPFDLRLFDEFIETYPSRVSADEVGGVIIIRIDY